MRLKIECKNSANRGIKRNVLNLNSTYGRFRLQKNCIARLNNEEIKPSFRNYVQDPADEGEEDVTYNSEDDC